MTSIYSRSAWNARNPKVESRMIKLKHPVNNVVLVETGATILKNIQDRDMKLGLNDIQYNFLMAQNGEIYEGRGWDVNVDDFQQFFEEETIVIGFLGIPRDEIFTRPDFLKALVSDGVALRKLLQNTEVQLSNLTFDEKLYRSFISREEWNPLAEFEKVELKKPVQRITVMECEMKSDCTNEV